jgi:hypothetical protein
MEGATDDDMMVLLCDAVVLCQEHKQHDATGSSPDTYQIGGLIHISHLTLCDALFALIHLFKHNEFVWSRTEAFQLTARVSSCWSRMMMSA